MKYFQQELYKKGVALFKSGATNVVIVTNDCEHAQVFDLNTFKLQYKQWVGFGAVIVNVYVK